jgi:glutamine amidotransferase
MKIGIINTNSGNFFSLFKILEDFNCDYLICSKPNEIKKVDKIIIPGVGSFDKVMNFLNKQLLTEEIKEQVLFKKKFLLGICLGMQILFEKSSEGISTTGLSVLKGQVISLKEKNCKSTIPHIGWNSIEIKNNSLIMKNIKSGTDFYFAHSFVVEAVEKNIISAKTFYDVDFISCISSLNIFGVQFHPEKSSSSGRTLIKNFLDL